ncbi:MAG: dephospho-CoA kinase [Melioribacteraceae bacterium]|nr:dephospho-CoA kinase [Melioribacteraceae bacterium]
MSGKFKIAVTGGIGAGKSEVCAFLESSGYKVIYADKIAKDLLYNHPVVKNKIIKFFGSEAYTSDGPDKTFLARNVFSNMESLEKINSIIHPETLKIIQTETNKILESEKFVFVESALIFEAKREKYFDLIILVVAEKSIRVKRTSGNLQITESEVLERMNMQIDDDIKRQRADFTIENNDSLDGLHARCRLVLGIIKTLSVL